MAEKKVNYTLLSQGEEAPPPLQKPRGQKRRIWLWALAGILILVVNFTVAITQSISDEDDGLVTSNKPGCPQYPPLESPSEERQKLETEVRNELSSDAFSNKSLKKLQGAIQIPTESFDNMGKVGEDSRWDIFADLHAYLKEVFPLVSVPHQVTRAGANAH